MARVQIAELDRYKSDWTSQGVLCLMSDLKSYEKKDGSGNSHIFKFELKDTFGIIKVCAFDQCATDLCRSLKINRHYLISNGRLVQIPRKYSNGFKNTE